MSDLDVEKIKNNARFGLVVLIAIFGAIFYLVYSILSRLELGDISVHVFLLLVLLLMIRPRTQQPVVMMPQNPFHFGKHEEGMEVG